MDEDIASLMERYNKNVGKTLPQSAPDMDTSLPNSEEKPATWGSVGRDLAVGYGSFVATDAAVKGIGIGLEDHLFLKCWLTLLKDWLHLHYLPILLGRWMERVMSRYYTLYRLEF